MDLKVMWAALVCLGGWLWFYLFLRQLIFNFATALPMLRRFEKAGDGLIAPSAGRYMAVSVIVWLLVCGGTAALVLHFAALYLKISFAAGGVLGALIYIRHYGPDTKSNFNDFCSTYYRFVPDDELRTAMYNSKTGQMKARLGEMGADKAALIPEFKRDK